MNDSLAVWGVGVRALHWLLATAVIVAWLSSSGAGVEWHEIAGYTVVGIVVFRSMWGVICGPRSARLSLCLRARRQISGYCRDFARGRERRFFGHNPLGSLMVMGLLACVASVCFTGWLYTTDRFWGYGWLSNLHHILAWLLVVLIIMHVVGVLVTALRHRDNLVVAMITGRKLRRLSSSAINH